MLADESLDHALRQREGRNAPGGERIAGGADHVARREHDLRRAAFGEPPRRRLDRLLVFAAEADHVGQGAMGEIAPGLIGDLVHHVRQKLARRAQEPWRHPIESSRVVEAPPHALHPRCLRLEAHAPQHFDQHQHAQIARRMRAPVAIG
jgi:hypothetical protein